MDGGAVAGALPESESLPFAAEDSFTDVILVVDNKQIFTNRSLLAYASPVFSCMFTDDFKEKNEKVINLPDKSHAAICDLISFLHPGVEFKVTIDTVFDLLPLAEEYQISVLKSKCEQVLLGELQKQIFPTAEFIIKCMEVAEKCDLEATTDACIKLMSDPDQGLEEVRESRDISLPTKCKIYEARIARLESERQEMETWKLRMAGVKNRLRDIIVPHDEHCRCRTEIKLRSSLQRCCSYCSRNWCSDNISTDSYRSSYMFFCNHKVGFHISHDAIIRNFIEGQEGTG